MTKTDIVQFVKSSVTMRQICDLYGIPVHRNKSIVCPFHDDHDPSMRIYDGKGGYHCFACGAHGDVIAFVEEYSGLSFVDAIQKINEDFSLGLKLNGDASRSAQLEAEKKAFERRKQIENDRKRYEALQDAYFDAVGRLAELEHTIKEERQKNAKIGVPERLMKALSERDRVIYEMYEAEDAIMREEKRVTV